MGDIKKIVLAYSGGLDTSVIMRWLVETYQCDVVGRKSPVSLYDPAFATFEADQVYNQADATGFIRLNALRLRIRALTRMRTSV